MQLMKIMPDTFSTLFGKVIPSSLNQQLLDMEKEFTPVLTGLQNELNALQKAGNSPSPKYFYYQLLDPLLKSIAKDIPRDCLAIDYIIDYLTPKKDLPEDSYLLETSYLKYMDAINEVSKEVVSNVNMLEIDAYLDLVFSYQNDVMTVGQSLINDFPKYYKVLSKPRKYFTKKQAEHDIALYDNLASQYEKGIAVLVGIIELISGNKREYLKIRRRRLANNLKTVGSSKYSLLATGFDKSIRNALAHGSKFINPLKKTVKFYDPIENYSSELTYKEVREKAKELSALTIAIYRLPVIIKVEELRKFKEMISLPD